MGWFLWGGDERGRGDGDSLTPRADCSHRSANVDSGITVNMWRKRWWNVGSEGCVFICGARGFKACSSQFTKTNIFPLSSIRIKPWLCLFELHSLVLLRLKMSLWSLLEMMICDGRITTGIYQCILQYLGWTGLLNGHNGIKMLNIITALQ